jgi:hypothetical protein
LIRSSTLTKPIVTEITPAGVFYEAEELPPAVLREAGPRGVRDHAAIKEYKRRPARGGRRVMASAHRRRRLRLLEPEVGLEQGAQLHPSAV